MIRVLVADNSRIHTHLLAEALQRDPALHVVPFESDSSGLVAAIRTEKIEVLVINSSLDEQPGRGFDVLQEVRAQRLKTRVVMLLDSSKDEVVLQAFRAGAMGIYSKNQPVEFLGKCVRCVHQGQIWADNQQLGVALGALASSPTLRAVNANGMNLLTERELQVVRCLAEGLTNREIAERLKLSPHTIKNYLFRIFDKLGVSSRIELLFLTLNHGSGVSLTAPAGDADKDGNSLDESALLQKAAEAGLPAAQLGLAQWYLTRRNGPQDLVQAYMWYLVATERALQARTFLTKMMTPEQIDQAQQGASVWLSRLKHTPPALSDPARPATRPAVASLPVED
ncbi:MAG: LuxR C-terminal-related transcriptional regulator [Candidatus Sulfotelmatobacter sp.]